MSLSRIKLKPHTLVASLFLLLAISLESLMFGYWSLVLKPRLRAEAESNAKILAESQAKSVSALLYASQQAITQDDIDAITDQVLVFIEPELKRPYFLGVSLELDYEVLEVVSETLDLSEGNMHCITCFPVTTALYSQDTDELLGVANFMVSDAFFEKLKDDVKQILFLESVLGLMVLLVVWVAVNILVHKLNFEILTRRKVENQLRFAKEQAEKASQTKSEFLANMSHEIRTPLNAIIGMAYILLKTPLNKRQQDLLNKLDSSSHLLLSLINDLLDFSKIEAGKLELESTCFKLDEVLDNLAKLVMTKAGEKGLDIMYHTSRDIPMQLIGDPLRLGQVLLNLINNAIKFTENGEILLSVEVVDPRKCRNLSDYGVCLQFSVHDTGIGIKEEDIDKLFHSFTQADSSTTRKFGGTGLGLSISRQLIHLMGGDIWVESVFGKGSTFTFTASFEKELEHESLRHILPNTLQNTHALIIDDSKISQNIFQQMLTCFGFKVSIASSAQEGMQILERYALDEPIELILMDWQMPGMDGLEATLLIKNQLSLPMVPKIVLVTAYANQPIDQENKKQLDDYLVKPISQSVLYDSIINIFSEQQKGNFRTTGEKKDNSLCCLAEKHVLLTEDNVTNQEVACVLLEEFELQVSIANNGKEAVDAVQQQRFDLILMDLQMPEMDGFEATRHIRQSGMCRDIPIIAMTAHAMRGDREKCLNAQMDDYITKPVDVEKFFALIEKWLVTEPNPEQPVGMEPVQQPPNESELNLSEQGQSKLGRSEQGRSEQDQSKLGQSKLGQSKQRQLKQGQSEQQQMDEWHQLKSINMSKALERVRGKHELIYRLLTNFKTQKADIGQQIAQAIDNQEMQMAKALVHSLKGEAGTLEANELFQSAKALEQHILQHDDTKIAEYLPRIESALQSVLADIQQLEKEISEQLGDKGQEAGEVKAATPLDPLVLAEQLQELAGLLKDNNLRAKKVANNISQEMNLSDHSQHWSKVLQALSELDFEVAQQHLVDVTAELDISI